MFGGARSSYGPPRPDGGFSSEATDRAGSDSAAPASFYDACIRVKMFDKIKNIMTKCNIY